MSGARVELGVPVVIPEGEYAGLHLLLDVDDEAMVAGDPLLLIVARDHATAGHSSEVRRRVWPDEVGPMLADWGLAWP